jgi:hypothetical protein
MRTKLIEKSSKEYTLNRTSTVAKIHQAIIKSDTVRNASKKLGLADPIILASHLGKFILDGKILDFDSFKELSVERAKVIWGHKYAQPLSAPKIRMAYYSAIHIYEAVKYFDTIRVAASNLGVRDHSLARFIENFSYENKKLTFKRLKSLNLTHEELALIFIEHEPLIDGEPRCNLTPEVVINFWGEERELSQDMNFDLLAAKFENHFVNNSILEYSFFTNNYDSESIILTSGMVKDL